MPIGSVAYYLDYGTPASKLLGTAPVVNCWSYFTTRPTALPAGTHTVTAMYLGSADYAATTSNSVAQTINAATTAVALTASASGAVTFGTAVTFTASVTDIDTGLVPNGVVQFWDGTTLLATVGLNTKGTASITRSLARGSHSITATYVGNASFNGSTSSAMGLTVS
jgi:hypothetical protein